MENAFFATSLQGRFLLLFVFIAVGLSMDLNSAAQPYGVRISCGSWHNTYTPGQNFMWSKDNYYTGGSAANASVRRDIAPQLNTLRYFQISDGPENCYNVSAINGYYVVRFFFAFGPMDNSNMEPIFDISLEGTQVYSLKQAWSYNRDLSYSESRVFIVDNAATACFHSTGHGNPSVMSVEVLQIPEDAYSLGPSLSRGIILRTIKRVNCGTKAPGYGIDYNANPWGGDRYWATDMDLDKGLSTSITTVKPIAGASVSPNFFPEVIYQTAAATTGMMSLTYSFEVEPSQNYSIWLHFAEISPEIRLKEQRIFDVLVNDKPLYNAIDIVALAGGQFTAIVLNKTITIDGRILTLSFRSLQGGILINAFEIFQVIRMEYATTNQEVWALQAIKHSLSLPSRFGWNGDPCVPQAHPWNGVDCQFSHEKGTWFIDGLDLSYNKLNGSIPETLGRLTQLRKLFLNSNMLSGKVPIALGGGPIHGASFNFSDNSGLCGVPGLSSCGTHLSAASKAGIALGSIIAALILFACGLCFWQRQKNINRAQRVSISRDAPYAKARTTFSKDVQLSRSSREPYVPHYMQQL